MTHRNQEIPDALNAMVSISGLTEVLQGASPFIFRDSERVLSCKQVLSVTLCGVVKVFHLAAGLQ